MDQFIDEPTTDCDQDIADTIARLAARWPMCFALAEDLRMPLKVGIFHDLKAALGDAISQERLSRALACYCAAPSYQRRLMKDGAPRIDLDGQRAGTVTATEAMWARVNRTERDKYRRKRAPAVNRSSLADLQLVG